MSTGQQTNSGELSHKVTFSQRIVAIVVLAAILGLFAFLRIAADGNLDLSRILGICEFKRTYRLPCVGCWITTSAIAFVQGRIFDAFYIQPAGAIICSTLAVIGVFALLIGIFGVNFRFLKEPISRRAIKYVVVSLIIILVSGWAVTISRAIAAGDLP
jgi:sorbitol-specific phosphotransferase system component IIC